MARKSRSNPEIRAFILHNVEAFPGDVARLVAEKFKISRVTANRYLDKLVASGALASSGETKARRYSLKLLEEKSFELETKGLEEHIVWREKIAPLLVGENENVIEICQHGVTEMINNVIDHSQSPKFMIHVLKNAAHVEVVIHDFGIGIFKKIADECGLSDQREAILELSKGKLTTDPTKHSGEGIFFTSRMVSRFFLRAGSLALVHERDEEDDWLIETEDKERPGTLVSLCVNHNITHKIQDVFSKYEKDEDGAKLFTKTHVPLTLAMYGQEQLVSRSQARRVLARFNKFSEVMLDFKDVKTIGQAFADEIFRVFKNEHPEVDIIPVRASLEIVKMIERVQKGGDSNQSDLPLTGGTSN